MTWPHTDFDAAFEGGRLGDFDVSVRRIGDVEIVSGTARVCDADGESWMDVRDLPAGTFPVEAAIATRDGHEAIAAVRVVFERVRSTTWEARSRDREPPHPPFELPGVHVASGWIAIRDASRRDPAVERPS